MSRRDEKKDEKKEKKEGDKNLARADWIEQQLQRRVKEFTEEKKLLFYMGTWNANGKKPTEDLSTWILTEPYADVYCIGFQEIVDLNAGNLLVDHNASKVWEDLIEKTLKQQYVQICSRHLVGLSTCVYVKRDLRKFVTDIQSETVGVGIMGVGGNKGAVVIRFQIYDSTVCLVNSHLAAHKNNVQGRNSDFHNICNRVKFVDKRLNKQGKQHTYSIYEHDHLFWIGDLNYRLNLNDMGVIHQRIDVQDWPFLLSHDQLNLERAAGNAFKRFKEGPIEFPPTYKYLPGTSKYERREDKKQRLPAWCDRIQWIGDDIKQMWYRRAELTASDHKPVMAMFEAMVKMLIPEKKKLVQQALGRQLDAWENECIPKVAMSSNAVLFPRTSYDTPFTQTLRVENTGQVIVQFHFQPKMQDDAFCKPWLSVKPEFGIVPPKETLEISLTVHVDRRTAQALNSGLDTLDDVLIFQVENGPDLFITVTGDYLRSCFGSTVEYLCNTLNPIRSAHLPAKDAKDAKDKDNKDAKDSKDTKDNINKEAKVLPLPKEIWRLVDYIYRSGMDVPGIFVTTGNQQEIEHIRECLDTGTEFAAQRYSIHSVCEALTRLLESFAEPIFPAALCAQYNEGMNLTAWCMQALTQLTPAQYNAFIYLVSFIREVLKHSDKNELSPNVLVLVFSRCLMHATPLQEVAGVKDRPKSWIVLSHFLTSDDFV